MRKDWMYLLGISYFTYPQGLPNLKMHVLMTRTPVKWQNIL